MLERLLRASVTEEVPSVVLQPTGTLQFCITTEEVGVDTRILARIPVGVCA